MENLKIYVHLMTWKDLEITVLAEAWMQKSEWRGVIMKTGCECEQTHRGRVFVERRQQGRARGK